MESSVLFLLLPSKAGMNLRHTVHETGRITKHVHLMKYIAVILLFLATGTSTVLGQSEKLSKKELARQERKERKAREAVYQVKIDDAHRLFYERQYAGAIAKYEEALKIIPGEAYPTAKITDLKIILASLEEEQTAEEPPEKAQAEETPVIVKEPEEIPEAPKEVIVEVPVEEPIIVKEEPKIEQEESAPEQPEEEKAHLKQVVGEVEKSIEEIQIELAEQYPEGITEEVYREGNKTITKRVVVKNNRGNEYKQVQHDWGGKYYFKNDISITQRVWQNETSE